MYKNLVITESDRQNILSQYNDNSLDYVISDWVSPDDKYVIFLDNLIEVETKKIIGNIWENFDNFKLFLKHSFNVSKNVPQTIKEEVLETINKLVLTESTKNYNFLKPYVKELLREFDVLGGIKDFANWGSEQLSSAYKGVTDFAKTVGSGAVSFVKSISQGDWKQAFDIIGKGVIYLMRRVRDFMYHPVGMVIDALFVTLAPETVGVTEVLKWLPWLVIVILDILEITGLVTPEEESPLYMRFLFLGIDVLGLVSTGAVSKAAKALFEGLGLAGKSIEEGAQIVAKNPAAKGYIQKMVNGFKELPSFFERASQYLKNSKLGGFFSQAFGKLGKIIKDATTQMEKLLGTQVTKGLKVAGTTTGILYGSEKLINQFAGGSDDTPQEISLMTSGQADYGEF